MHIFISYAKADTHDLALKLRDTIITLPNVTAWMDTSLYSGEDWAVQIQDEIDRADLVIVILSPDVNRPLAHSKGRSFVHKEIHYAQQVKKTIIPVMAQITRVPVQLAGIQYIDLTQDMSSGIQHLTSEIAARAEIENTELQKSITSTRFRRNSYYWIYSLSFVLSIAVIGFALIQSNAKIPIESQKRWSATFYSNAQFKGSSVPITNIEALNFNWGKGIPKLNGVSIPDIESDSFSARFASNQPFQDGVYNFVVSSEGGVRLYIDGLLFLDKFIDRSLTTDTTSIKMFSGDHNLVVEYGKFGDQAVLQVQWFLTSIGTDNQIPGLTTSFVQATVDADQMGRIFKGVNTNQMWKPISKMFLDTEMVLVPVGCFLMGNNDEKTDRHQCVIAPFWIDKTEVTNKQYGSAGYFKGEDHPRDSVMWVNAHDFCSKRGGRLPTELEWEFAARGPDSIIYPWGNGFLSDKVTYYENARGETANIGRRPSGASWVGAQDISGNVFEWTSSIMMSYPYKSNDGRENIDDLISDRVNRGGSYLDHSDLLPLWYRRGSEPNDPTKVHNDIGFRCVLDFKSSDLSS